MKKFIMVCPLQPEGKLNKTKYEVGNNEELEFQDNTSFPIIPVIHSYVEENEEIEVLAILIDNDNARKNLDIFKQEMEELKAKKPFQYTIKEIETPYKETIDTHYELFVKLIEQMEEKNKLYACITFGTKPISNIIMMALNYGYQMVENVTVECIVYGLMNHVEKTSVLYDSTSMFYMNQTLNKIQRIKPKNPLNMVKMMLDM